MLNCPTLGLLPNVQKTTPPLDLSIQLLNAARSHEEVCGGTP